VLETLIHDVFEVLRSGPTRARRVQWVDGPTSMKPTVLRLAVFAVLALLWPGQAWAHKNGISAQGCMGCHGAAGMPNVTVTADTSPVNLGQQITLTISIQATNGPAAGFFIQSNGFGTFSIVDSGTKLIGAGVTHTQPRIGSGGQTTFKVGWKAPAQAGGVDFNVYALSANGDGTSKGDAGGEGFLSVAFGCGVGTKYFHDFDGDGYGGITSGYTMNCAQPKYYALQGGDCNDNSEKIYPGAPEICDGKDNNCDGNIDEGLPITAYCQDDDNDGHGVTGKATKMGCGVSKGFGLCDNDCNDNDPTIYPTAPELCNSRDDNCNNQIDENARLICGVGWCARYGEGCTSTLCTPGKPRKEECNDFDDDCDGVVDNGTDLELCGKPGFVCKDGECLVAPQDAGVGEIIIGTDPGSGDGTSQGGANSTVCSVSFSRASNGKAGAILLLVGFGLALRRARSRSQVG
jgi:hypothetical protein